VRVKEEKSSIKQSCRTVQGGVLKIGLLESIYCVKIVMSRIRQKILLKFKSH